MGLLEELKTLRKGRGVHTRRIGDQLGPNLRIVCGISAGDDPASIRDRVIQRLGELASTLPDDLGLAATAALGVHPEAQHAFLNQRIQWLAEKIGRDERTARRRIDDGIAQLAEAATPRAPKAPRQNIAQPEGWYIEKFSAAVMLDHRSPEVIETRRIVVERDGVDQLKLAMGLPRDPTDRRTAHDLAAQIIYGGTLIAKEHTSDSQFSFVLQLPHTINTGEQHEFAMIIRVPEDQPMRPHYVQTSRRRCDQFDLRIRFDKEHLPTLIWKVSGIFPRALDDDQPTNDILTPDRAGELHLDFHNLTPGIGYGVQWRRPPAYELQHTTVDRPSPRSWGRE